MFVGTLSFRFSICDYALKTEGISGFLGDYAGKVYGG